MPENNLTKNNETSSRENMEAAAELPKASELNPDSLTEEEIAQISTDTDDDDRLPIDNELIKIEDSPYDEIFAEDRKNFNDPNTELSTTDISEQIIPRDDNFDVSANQPDSTDKIYTLPDQAVSSTEKDELLAKLHTKIPGIIQHQNGDLDIPETAKPPEQKVEQPIPPREKIESHKIEPLPVPEEKTEIFTPPQNFKEEKKESNFFYLKGKKLMCDDSIKLRSGEQLEYLGRKYFIKKQPLNRAAYLKLGIIGLVALIAAVFLLSEVFSGGNSGKLVGLLINSETQTVVPEAQVTLNELGQSYYTDENGMFIINQIETGDWSLSASKPQFRTAAIGFSIPRGQTRVVTVMMDPTVPTVVNENTDKQKADVATVEKKIDYGKLTINTNVPNARVIIDNKVMGESNQSYSRLYSGKHKLVVTKEGYKEYSGTVSISADKTTTLDITLEEIEVAYNPSEISYQEYLNKADDLSSQEQWQEALGNYTLALAKHEDGAIYHKRAFAYQNLNQNNMAVADLFKASLMYTNQGSISEAIKCLNSILELSPQDTRALRERGFAHLRSGQFEVGVKDLYRAVEIDEKSFDNQVALGEALYLMGDYKESLKYLKKARKINAENARVYGLTALASLAKGDDKDARKYYGEFTQRANSYDQAEFESDPDWQRLAHLVSLKD